MKKHLLALGAASVMALGALSGSVFATDVTGEGGTADAVHTVGKSYIINIPGKINLSKSGNNAAGTANVSASKVLLGVGETLTVSVRTSTGKLQASSGAVTSEIPYTIAINGGSAVNATTLAGDDKYSEVFTMEAGTTTQANTPLVFTTTSFSGVTLAAEHKDTLTFKVSVASAAPTFATAEIAGKTWMTENLKLVPEGATWEKDGIYVDDATGEVYYTWDAAQTACPDGWKLPTEADFGNLIAGHDASWIEGAPFNGVRAGRVRDGELSYVGDYGSYWSDTEGGDSYAYDLYFYDDDMIVNYGDRTFGYSVRCVAE